MDTNKPGGSGSDEAGKGNKPGVSADNATKNQKGGPQLGGAPNPEPIEFLGVLHEAPGTKPNSALPMDTPRDQRTNQPPSAHPNPMAGKDQITASTVGRTLGAGERATQNPMAGRGPTPVEVATQKSRDERERRDT